MAKSRTTHGNHQSIFGPNARYQVRWVESRFGSPNYAIVDRHHRCPVTGGYAIVAFCDTIDEARKRMEKGAF